MQWYYDKGDNRAILMFVSSQYFKFLLAIQLKLRQSDTNTYELNKNIGASSFES
uniref:Uncharacterized protein n=1 Tax=Arundo donax TaxID=35708 RepID=A0A0A9FRE2_ARUDO